MPATRAVRISRAGFSISMMSTEANSLSEQLTLRTGSRERPSWMLNLDLKSGDKDPDVWTKRGTALLLALAE